ncbi:MAG TPA: MFS transporter [Geminicoccaceae bacterium]|nr:MFS transporter [Geminicoccus sp.]HMU51220.1 MFS transporter [Geminicoccaceae bacterium]
MTLVPASTARIADAVVFFVNGLGLGLWAGHIPILQALHGLDEAALGVTLLCMALGAIVAMPLTGPAAARYGSRRCTVAAGVVYGLALGLPFLASGPVALAAAVLLLGAANGAMDVSMNTQASAIERQQGRAIMSSFHAFFSLGGVAGALLAGLLVASAPTAASGMLPCGMAIAIAVVVAGRWLIADSGHAHGFSLPGRAAIGVGLLALLAMTAEGAVLDWSAVFIASGTGATAPVAAMGYAAFSVAMTVGRLTGDAVVRRLGRGRTLGLSAALAALAILLALSGGTALAILGFGIAGLGLANAVPVLFSAGAALPGLAPGVGVAMVATMGYAGFLLGPPLIGITAEAAGLRWALLLVVPGLVVVALAGARLVGSPAAAPRIRAAGSDASMPPIGDRPARSRP